MKKAGINRSTFTSYGPPPVNPAELLFDHIYKLQNEDIVIVHGKPFVVRPASPGDLERVATGFIPKGGL